MEGFRYLYPVAGYINFGTISFFLDAKFARKTVSFSVGNHILTGFLPPDIILTYFPFLFM